MNIERIEALVKKFAGGFLGIDGRSARNILRAALTELSETHTIELRAYEATVANLEQRIRQLEAERVPSLDILTDLIADGLRGTYHCTRVWSAWGIGTMSEDDFSPVEESGTPAEIAESIISLIAAAPAQEKA